MNILSLLTPKAVTKAIPSKMSVRQVLEIFDAHKYTVMPLVDEEGRYIATISEGDLLRFVKHHDSMSMESFESVSILDVERYRSYKCQTIDSSFKDIYELALEQNFVPLVDDRGIFIGIITRKKILLNFAKNVEEK